MCRPSSAAEWAFCHNGRSSIRGWAGDKLAAAVHRHKQADCLRAHPKMLRVKRQQRENDRDSEHIDQHDKEDGRQPSVQLSVGGAV